MKNLLIGLLGLIVMGMGCDYVKPTEFEELDGEVSQIEETTSELESEISQLEEQIGILEAKIDSIGIETDKYTELNTDVHTETGGYWEVLDGRVNTSRKWRLFSFKEVEGEIEIQGGYTITWINNTTKKVKIEATRLVFEDDNGIQVTDYYLSGAIDVTLEPGETRDRDGDFLITVGNVRVANSISRMGIYASFTEQFL